MNTATTGRTDRSSGVLLHVTSLPGPHGVGDLGPAAYHWIDQLARAKQQWWQILPLGPTGYADSPYQCFSAFAGNPNLISLEQLVDDGLLLKSELPTADFPSDTADLDRARPLKLAATEKAFRHFNDKQKSPDAADAPSSVLSTQYIVLSTGHSDAASPTTETFNAFCRDEATWLNDFSLFTALKDKHGGVAWWEWPHEHRIYDSRMAEKLAQELADEIELCKFRQFLFFRQWHQLRDYSHRSGVRIIGDMPIFISSDSADVWSRPGLFQLDKERRPTFVAGVPPDYFSATGQLWGNPLYAWEKHRETGFAWWIDRLKSTLQLVDLVRLDHFRGFEAYWAVPAGNKTAEKGSWEPGPNGELFETLQAALGYLPLIAEDLGVITPPVDALRRSFGLPGMRILQFAFGGAQEERFIPHHYDHHTVVYTGTHDNEATTGWFRNLSQHEREFLTAYAPGEAVDPSWALIRLAWASVADLAVAPLQDVLRLGNEARMNMPGTAEGNWCWRLDPSLLTDDLLDRLAEMTEIYQRTIREGEAPAEPAKAGAATATS